MRGMLQVSSLSSNATQVLGTLITEWDEGRAMCEAFLETEATAQQAARQLAAIAAYFGFDGWLINIENQLGHRPDAPPPRLHKVGSTMHSNAVSLVHTPSIPIQYPARRAASLEERTGKARWMSCNALTMLQKH